MNSALPASMCDALRRVAASIIFRRAVYGGEMSSFEALANERRRDPVSAPDLEYPVIGTYIELLDDLSQPLAHDQPVFGGMFWLSEKRFSGS